MIGKQGGMGKARPEQALSSRRSKAAVSLAAVRSLRVRSPKASRATTTSSSSRA